MDKIDGSYGSVAAPPLVVSICQFDFLAARCSEYGLDDFARRVRIGSLNANDSSHADLKRILIHYGIPLCGRSLTRTITKACLNTAT